MTMTDAELRSWAEAHTAGPMQSPVAGAVLVLLDDNARLKWLLQLAAERIAGQSEALSRKAERAATTIDGTHC